MATRNTPTTSTLEEWRVEFNELATDVGNVTASSQGDQLTTSATDIVGAINELETNVNAIVSFATKTASTSDVASSSGAVTSNVSSISHTLTLGGTLADDVRHADVTVTSSKVLATSTIASAVSINADVHVHTVVAGSFKFAFTNRSGGTLADDSTAIFNFVIL